MLGGRKSLSDTASRRELTSSLAQASPGELRVRETNGAVDVGPAREWLLPGATELFRGIYTRSGTGTAEILAVCSAISGEGRSTLSLGLGLTIAQDFPERRVLVVETDLQHPVLAEDFDVPPNPGLIECLLDGASLQAACRPTLLDNLCVVPAGGPTRNPRRLLASSRMAVVADAMRQTHDLVILDTPAVLVTSDAIVLADLADSVIFVVRAGVTPLPLVNKALEQVDEDKLRGVVLNEAHSAIPGWLRRLCAL